MKNKKLGNLEISEIIYGMWRIADANLSTDEIITLLEEMKALKINGIDTAAIYGDSFHDAERHLGNALKKRPDLREDFVIITKSGIKAREISKFPHYDFAKEFILSEVEKSLEVLNTSYIDVFLLHRPDVFCDFEDIYQTFQELKASGKVKEFGVSNFTPLQYQSLRKYLSKRNIELVTNQIELNLFSDEHIQNDNTWYLKGEEISPMIWSPMGGGRLFENKDQEITKIASKYNITESQLAISYLHNQGLNPITILGSNKIERYIDAIAGLEIKIDQVDMYRLLKLITKEDVK